MTTMPKAQEISRKWYIIDAANRPLGRTAAAAAAILRGKHKVDFAPHVDCGEKAILTGKKLEKKFYRHHSGWVGGLKEIRYDHLMRENPEKAMMLAVKGMLPDNTLGRKALTRVRIYKGEQHNNQAQNPTAWTL